MTKRLWWCGIAVVATVGCDATGRVGTLTKTTADVRVVNASTSIIDLLEDQSVGQGNAGIGFGATSQCMTVDIVSHGLSVRASVQSAAATPLPSFSADEKYIVVVTGNATSLQVLSLRNSAAAAPGKASARFINVGGSGNFDLYVTDPGAALGAPQAVSIGSGAASSYFDVPTTAQQLRITPAGSTAIAFDVGNVTIAAGARAMVILASPAPGSTTPRPFVVQEVPAGGC